MNAPGAGIAFMLASMFSFAVLDVLSRHLTQSYAVTQIQMIRFIMFYAFAVALIGRGRWAPVRQAYRARRPWLQVLRGIVMALEISIFTTALYFMPLADVHSIAAAAPLIVVILAGPMLGERVGLHRWLAVLVGFVGVILIVRPGFKEVPPETLIAVGAMLLWGIFQALSRLVARYDGHDTTTIYTATVALIGSVAVGPFNWAAPDGEGWLLLLASGVVGGCAHYFLIRATAAAEASLLQPFTYTLVLWAALLGWLAFGEYPDEWTAAGGAIIVLAGLYAMHRERVAARRRAEAGNGSP